MIPEPRRELYIGDNLACLQNQLSKTIDLIYLDPPFCSNREYHAFDNAVSTGQSFSDKWQDEKPCETKDFSQPLKKVLDACLASEDKEMHSYLIFLSARLLELHRILKKTGSIYLHCDDRASPWLRLVMDAIFKRQNYKNHIIWQRTSGRSNANRFGRVCDHILYYTAGKEYTWHTQWKPYTDEHIATSFNHRDEHGPYQRWMPQAPNSKATPGPEWRGMKPPSHRVWRSPTNLPEWARAKLPSNYKQLSITEKLDALDEIGMIDWPQENNPQFKLYLSVAKGIAPEDIWTDIKRLYNTETQAKGYPTQKPEALLNRIISSSSNEGDVVLDPFCGSGTTMIVAEQLNRAWVGFDNNPGVEKVLQSRVNDIEPLFSPPAFHVINVY